MEKVSEVLKKISNGEHVQGWSYIVGMCSNINNLFGWETKVLAQEFMDEHPDNSSVPAFPIPGCPDRIHGRTTFRPLAEDSYHSSVNQYTGTYGKTRREWAHWLAEKFEQVGQ